MTAVAILAALVISRQGGLLTGPGFVAAEKRLGWVMLCIGVACGFVAGQS